MWEFEKWCELHGIDVNPNNNQSAQKQKEKQKTNGRYITPMPEKICSKCTYLEEYGCRSLYCRKNNRRVGMYDFCDNFCKDWSKP